MPYGDIPHITTTNNTAPITLVGPPPADQDVDARRFTVEVNWRTGSYMIAAGVDLEFGLFEVEDPDLTVLLGKLQEFLGDSRRGVRP